MTQLEEVNFSNCQLQGNIAEANLSALTNVTDLQLDGNNLSGDIVDVGFEKLTFLKWLFLAPGNPNLISNDFGFLLHMKHLQTLEVQVVDQTAIDSLRLNKPENLKTIVIHSPDVLETGTFQGCRVEKNFREILGDSTDSRRTSLISIHCD